MPEKEIKIVVVYHSGYGHTQRVAEHVAEGAAIEGVTSVTILPVAEADDRWSELDEADAIIFGAPTYMGSASSAFKEFAEKTSKAWFTLAWKNKIAGGFTCSASYSGDKLNTLISFAILAAQHGMIWVGNDLLPGNNNSNGSVNDLNRTGFFLGVGAQANADQGPDVAPLQSDLETAEHYGQRVAEATARFNGVTL